MGVRVDENSFTRVNVKNSLKQNDVIFFLLFNLLLDLAGWYNGRRYFKNRILVYRCGELYYLRIAVDLNIFVADKKNIVVNVVK